VYKSESFYNYFEAYRFINASPRAVTSLNQYRVDPFLVNLNIIYKVPIVTEQAAFYKVWQYPMFKNFSV